jgi:hypothetical protein
VVGDPDPSAKLMGKHNSPITGRKEAPIGNSQAINLFIYIYSLSCNIVVDIANDSIKMKYAACRFGGL